MTTTTSSSTHDGNKDRRRAREDRGLRPATGTGRADRLPPAPRERRPVLAALAVLLIVGGATTAGLLAMRADERTPVLVAAQEIAAGSQITAESLTETLVAAEGTRLVPAADAASVIGGYARVTIGAGQLIDSGVVTDSGPVQPGSVAVGAALATGRTPATGLQPGDVVQLVRVDDAEGVVLVRDALVSSAHRPDGDGRMGGGDLVVTFIVDTADGAKVASVAAAGNLAAVLVTRGEPRGR